MFQWLTHLQNTESAASKSYITALRHVLDNGVCLFQKAELRSRLNSNGSFAGKNGVCRFDERSSGADLFWFVHCHLTSVDITSPLHWRWCISVGLFWLLCSISLTYVCSSSSDFLSNLLVLLIRILNSGISDSGLLEHLSEATAGSLNGVGHSTAYEELATYMYVIPYLCGLVLN